MRIVTWESDYKVLTKASADDFFNSTLPEITLFKFKTRKFNVAPHHGAFSIKAVSFGEESYFFGKQRLKLRCNGIIPVNGGQEYSSTINEETDSLSIFFEDSEVKKAAVEIVSNTSRLLDDPDVTVPATPEVPQIVFPVCTKMKRNLAGINAAVNSRDIELTQSLAQYCLRDLLATVLVLEPGESFREITKKSTREELLGRVLRAKSYIDEHNGKDCTLEMLAEVACMSKYHFLRVFREVLGVTPVTYARRRRLVLAAGALRRGECEKQCAKLAGFSSFMLFERAYVRAFGVLPHAGVN